MITHVAIQDINNKIWSLPKPNRHHHIIAEISKQGRGVCWKLLKEHVQGFLNDKGKFLNRKQAFFEAARCKQILPPYNPIDPSQRCGEPNLEPRQLFSEDIW